MMGAGAIWGFLGPPGVRELIVVVVVAFVLYGRSGVQRGLQRTRYGRLLSPWINANAKTAQRTAGPAPIRPKPKVARWGDRWFWLLAAMAVTAVATWIVTRILIASGSGMSH